MNTRTVVTVMAAAFLSVSLVSVSSAQDNNRSVPEGIEIITIIGKHTAPAVATTFLSVSRVPVSPAQDNNRSVPEGIEVITIIGKHTAPAVATACVDGMTSHTDVTARHRNGDGNSSDDVLESSRTGISPRWAIKRCSEQAGTSSEAQI